MIALFSAFNRVLVVWEQLQTFVHFGGTPLSEVVANSFLRVDY